ncbi:hypothetical protein [Endozoicomonas sp. GU-1]|uniref:hypothetical protein n=1 Tax=Endozoicomonas sp. GU-1 TaxID=3009078 RepID=UPI0022B39FF7|nr:hypothetical protein [Endozoicomonas sp. GU-1]WBA83300.1 hypothetical protein O2T12_09345 [Endozoicomonas sp. GU-1]WBA86230.1 hypothetical protein O3276_24005 [Endozoicomonas sp. GU-1]
MALTALPFLDAVYLAWLTLQLSDARYLALFAWPFLDAAYLAWAALCLAFAMHLSLLSLLLSGAACLVLLVLSNPEVHAPSLGRGRASPDSEDSVDSGLT